MVVPLSIPVPPLDLWKPLCLESSSLTFPFVVLLLRTYAYCYPDPMLTWWIRFSVSLFDSVARVWHNHNMVSSLINRPFKLVKIDICSQCSYGPEIIRGSSRESVSISKLDEDYTRLLQEIEYSEWHLKYQLRKLTELDKERRKIREREKLL